MYGEVIYGVFWKLPEEEKEKAEEYEAMENANSIYKDGEYTIWYGLKVMTLADNDNEFPEMNLLAALDLKKGRLKEEGMIEMKEIIQSIPYEMRDRFTAPRFYILWGE